MGCSRLASWWLCLVVLAGCRSGPDWVHPFGADDPLAGIIYDVADERIVAEADLLAALDRADFVLLGEEHDNLDHRRLEQRLIEGLSRSRSGRPLTALALEMIDTSQQRTLVEYLGTHGNELAGLGEALVWDQRGWPPFETYRPLVMAGLGAGAQIVAAGLPERTMSDVMAHGYGTLPRTFLRRTGLLRPLPADAMAALQHEIAAAQCGDLPRETIRRLARVRRAREASLADRVAAVAGRGRGIVIAGTEHARKDWGVPWYLANLRPGARSASVAFVEVGHGRNRGGGARTTLSSLAYDYVWFTPSAHPPGRSRCDRTRLVHEQLDARHLRPEAHRHPAALDPRPQPQPEACPRTTCAAIR